MKPTLILAYIKQNWPLLIITAIAVLLVLNEWLFQHLGALLYVPAAVFVWASVWRFCIHLRFRETIDADSHSGRAKADWDALTPAERILNTTLVKIGIGIAIAIVAASVGK
jgi:hypothetical protein